MASEAEYSAKHSWWSSSRAVSEGLGLRGMGELLFKIKLRTI
jgi:hypothetical protein